MVSRDTPTRDRPTPEADAAPEAARLRVMHVIPYIGKAQGGPVHALALVSGALRRAGCDVAVASVTCPADGEPVAFDDGVRVIRFDRSLGGMFRYRPGMARSLAVSRPEVVHSHGLWTYLSLTADRLARRMGAPHVLAPCGMLQGGALERSSLKKRVCLRGFQQGVLNRAACLHAKSDDEYTGLRRFGLRNPVAVVANPIDEPIAALPADVERFRAEQGVPAGGKVLLFLGRLHPVKGLPRLLEAWAALAPRCPQWRLLLAGPDEGGYRQVLTEQARAAGLAERVGFCGALHGQSKWVALAAADLFVMPSDFENFGSAIAEALAAGVPVVTTTGTPWRRLADEGCGWWVERSAAALEGALAEAMALTDDQRYQRGCRGAALAKAYRSGAVAGALLDLYAWLLGRAERPGFVRME